MVGKILIVDGVATNRIVFKAALAEAYYQPILAADGESCLHLARDNSPDLILLDLSLPDCSGVSLIKQLRNDPATRDIPLLALISCEQADTRLQAFAAGADDVLPKSTDLQSLLARVRNLLRGRDGLDGLTTASANPAFFGFAEPPLGFIAPGVVSILSGHLSAAKDWQGALARLMTDTILIQSREEAFSDANQLGGQTGPDVFLIGAGLCSSGDNLRLMSELRSRAASKHSAICILRPKGSKESAAIAFDMGADDIVTEDISPAELAVRLQTLVKRKRREDQRRATVQDGLRLAVIDPLTGLHNRRYAIPRLASIAQKAAADTTVFAVMVIDLDRFKLVNDRLGHSAGDSVLVEVARRLQANLREDDLLARIGGEEFLVAMPNTNFEDACVAADRLCHAVEEWPVMIGKAATLPVTVSIGLAFSTAGNTDEPISYIVDRADRALLAAKSGGRNKVTISRTAA